MNMDRDYKKISLRIIDKRNAYYAKRKKVKNTLLFNRLYCIMNKILNIIINNILFNKKIILF